MLYGRSASKRVLYKNSKKVHILPKQLNSAKIIRLAFPYYERLIMQIGIVKLSNEPSERNHINKQRKIEGIIRVIFQE